MTSQPIPASLLRNRLGEIWKRHDGSLVTLTRVDVSSIYPYAASLPHNPHYHWYDPYLQSSIGDHAADLVELIYDPRDGAPEYLDGAATPQPSPATAAPLSSAAATQSSGATKSCRRCAAWEQLTPHDPDLGRCVRHAPVLLERNHLGANWPTTSAHDHCFDFIAKTRHQ